MPRALASSRVFWAACVCALAALCGCGPRETPAERGAKEGVLIVGNGADPEDLDPQIISGLAEAHIVMGLFEGLVALDGQTLQPIPAAAHSWMVSENGMRYTFRLQPQGRWSDGKPVTAEDFVFALRRALTPSVGAKYAPMLFVIKNARDVYAGKLPKEALGVRALDDKTLQIDLEYPSARIFEILASPIAFPVREDALRAHGDPYGRGSRWTRAGNLVGNGPFVLTRWSVNDAVEMRRNPHYWDAAKVGLNGIKFVPIADQSTEERAFRAGQLHITDSIPASKLPGYRHSGQNVRQSPWLGAYYYVLNTQRPPLNDARVRRALSLAVDRKAITDVVLKGAHLPADYFVPAGAQDAQAPARADGFDPALARELLAQAGYPDGKGFPEFSILYNTSDMHRPIAEAIQAMWKKYLNIDVRLHNVSWGAYLAQRQERDFDIARASWVADFNDPVNFYENFQGDNPLNRSGWKDARFDALLADAARTDDHARRQKDFRQAEEILQAQAPLIPIFHYNRAYLIRPEVKGWTANILDMRPLKGVSLAKEANP